MQASLAQIERLNPRLNAIVSLYPEQALAQALAADEKQARGEALAPLHGLPVAHKDLFLTRGMRTTFGSPIFRDFIPDQNLLIVDRLQAAGAISVGKTNTPEFGAGSQTFNTVFGKTLNPYDPSKTCGGSSGGAAVALATGMVPLADGSDMGGSLRCPANFCNVVGLRTSPGRVPIWPAKTGWSTLSVRRTDGAHGGRLRADALHNRGMGSRAARLQSPNQGACSRGRWRAISAVCASPGAPTSAGCRWMPASPRCWLRSARPSPRSAARSMMQRPICPMRMKYS